MGHVLVGRLGYGCCRLGGLECIIGTGCDACAQSRNQNSGVGRALWCLSMMKLIDVTLKLSCSCIFVT